MEITNVTLQGDLCGVELKALREEFNLLCDQWYEGNPMTMRADCPLISALWGLIDEQVREDD